MKKILKDHIKGYISKGTENQSLFTLLKFKNFTNLKDLLKDLPSPEKRGNNVRYSLQCADFQRKKGEFSALLTSPQIL